MREALEKSKGTIDGPLSHKLITQRISTSRHCGIQRPTSVRRFKSNWTQRPTSTSLWTLMTKRRSIIHSSTSTRCRVQWGGGGESDDATPSTDKRAEEMWKCDWKSGKRIARTSEQLSARHKNKKRTQPKSSYISAC